MKKLFTFVALAATMFCASATSFTDNLTPANVYSWSSVGATNPFTSPESGVKYELQNVGFPYGNVGYMPSSGSQAYLYVTERVGGIEAVKSNKASNFKVYLSADELTPDNYTTGDEYAATGLDLIDVSDKGYKYACVVVLSGGVSNMAGYPTLVWNDELGGGDEPTPEPGDVKSDVIDYAALSTLEKTDHESGFELWNGTLVGAASHVTYTVYQMADFYDSFAFFNDVNTMISTTTPAESPLVSVVAEVVETTPLMLYGSDEPITISNYASATLLGELNETATTLDVTGQYKYYALYLPDADTYSILTKLTLNYAGGAVEPEPTPGATYTDTIDFSSVLAQNPDMKWDESYDYGSTEGINASLTYTGESGTKYDLTELIANGTYIMFAWDYPKDKGSIVANNESKYLKSVTVNGRFWSNDEFAFYGSTEEFAYSNRWDAPVRQSVYPYTQDYSYDVEGIVKYALIQCAQVRIESIVLEWTDDKPVLTVATPEINCWNDPVEVGNSVYVSSSTEGATIHATVYVNDELAETQPEAVKGNMTIVLPGKAGDKVRIEAYASKEDWKDSETATWECASLAMSPAPRPTITKAGSTYIPYVLVGDELRISVQIQNEAYENVDLEGATVTYSYGWNDWDNDVNYTSDETTAPAPVLLTVPENAPIGASFFVKATANAEGYRTSNEEQLYTQVISNVLSAPTFSLEDGATVKAGGTLTIYRNDRAAETHYTVNGGEEQVSTDWSVNVPVTEQITVEAWSTGEAPFEPSEHVTVTVAPEHFEAWQDVILPGIFGMDSDETSGKTYPSLVVNEETGVEYEYVSGQYGGFYDYYDYSEGEYIFAFYMSTSSYGTVPSIHNTNTAKNDAYITAVQLDNCSRGLFVFLSESPITTITSEMTRYDYAESDPIRFTVAGPYDTGSSYEDYVGEPGKMISLADVHDKLNGDEEYNYTNKTYIAIVPVQPAQSTYMGRAIISYDKDMLTGVENVIVDALNGVEAVYNLNGVKVDAENLTPGVYVRIANGKAAKVLVK